MRAGRRCKKLEYMDALMRSVRERPPRARQPGRDRPLRRLRRTLRQHYRIKRRHYGVDYPNFYDRDLRRLFSDAPEFAANITAAQFIGRIRRATRRVVAEWTGIYQYTIDQVIEDMIGQVAASSSCGSPCRRTRRARSSPCSSPSRR